jgi:hypothetical protein
MTVLSDSQILRQGDGVMKIFAVDYVYHNSSSMMHNHRLQHSTFVQQTLHN